ncbi:MlaE family lipid ABC transporter permease subunit [Lichenihabitans psoromatis]|uniref:ABC transporter permease n=1 Tax=Lichenihabitans psoromatis TaxID=2528642 RepID=UPI003CCB5D0D
MTSMATLSQPGSLRWSTRRDGTAIAIAAGSWTITHVVALAPLIDKAAAALRSSSVVVDLGGVGTIDTFGACLLNRLIAGPRPTGLSVSVKAIPDRYRALLDMVTQADGRQAVPPLRSQQLAWIEALGRGVVGVWDGLLVFFAMLGAVAAALGRVVLHPRRFRLTSTVQQLDRVGFQAIPIIVLITLLIGAIIAQQGIFNFRKFGAESYVVDLVGILVLRELGVLVVAIMVAGRSGSSYTAELGSMTMREEIDALRTMGLDPVEVLILPRIVALVLALPILAFVGAMAALTGGGLVTWFYGGTSPIVFLAQLRDAVSVTHLEVGLLKAPFMALVIGVVACAEGLRVKGSAESLGLRTTASVVESIFLVIVLDGVFAMIFAAIGM